MVRHAIGDLVMGNSISMGIKPSLLVGVFGLLLTCVVAMPSTANVVIEHASIAFMLAELDSGQAVQLIQDRTGGKVLSVVQTTRNGKSGYEVKVLMPEGRIRKLFIDKQTGAVAG